MRKKASKLSLGSNGIIALDWFKGNRVFAAVNKSGYSSLPEASEKMKKVKNISFKPNLRNTALYEKLYKEYIKLSEYFAKGNTMDILKNIN